MKYDKKTVAKMDYMIDLMLDRKIKDKISIPKETYKRLQMYVYSLNRLKQKQPMNKHVVSMDKLPIEFCFT